MFGALFPVPLTTAQVSILQQPAFCVVRSLIAFRLTSTHKDYCVVGTDAGKITILEYLPETSEVRTMQPLSARQPTWNVFMFENLPDKCLGV